MINYLSRVFTFFLFFLFSLSAQAENINFETDHFSGSGKCSLCHDDLTDDTSGEDVSIVKDWGNSMMANATKDPFWRAKVATELQRNPHLASVINDTCSKCHAPVANYETTKLPPIEEVPAIEVMTLFGIDGILNPSHEFYDGAMSGVSCTVCHQIEDDESLGTLDGFSGEYKINNSKIIYGQFSDIVAQPMINNTRYTPEYSAHISDSDTCATCHNLKTPFVDADGELASTTPESEFPEQMPYTEWQNSDFDDAGSNPQSCQDCHMPTTTALVSNRPTLVPKDGFAKHHLVGANTTMLTLLRDNAVQLDVISSDLDLSIDRARAMLQSAVNLEIVSASVNNGILEARVKLDNNSGHKTPTAYPSRRMWLHFKVTDSNNNVVFESGKINTDGSSIKDADNDINQTVFEPHYNLITSSHQVQIYETIMANTDGEVNFTLLRSALYLKDNRLTPKGFDKADVPDDVAVKGQAASDPDFNLGSDEIIYRFPVLAAGELDISVSLNYQTISHGFLQDLYDDSGQVEQVADFKEMYDLQSLKHEVMVSTQSTVISDGSGVLPAMPAIIMLLLL